MKRVAPEPAPSGRNLLALGERGGDERQRRAMVVPAASPPSLAGETKPKKRAGVLRRGRRGGSSRWEGRRSRQLRGHEPPPEGTPLRKARAISCPPRGDRSTHPPRARAAPTAVAAQSRRPPRLRLPLATAATPLPQHPSHAWAPSHASTFVATPAPKPPPSAPSAPLDVGTGYLTLDTYPWTRVSENGRVLGTTPLVHVALSAGTHVLTLENPEQGIKQSYPVTLKADETLEPKRLGSEMS